MSVARSHRLVVAVLALVLSAAVTSVNRCAAVVELHGVLVVGRVVVVVGGRVVVVVRGCVAVVLRRVLHAAASRLPTRALMLLLVAMVVLARALVLVGIGGIGDGRAGNTRALGVATDALQGCRVGSNTRIRRSLCVVRNR